MLQAQTLRIAHPPYDINALPTHEALEIKTSRVVCSPHLMQTQTGHTHNITGEKWQCSSMHVEAYKACYGLLNVVIFQALQLEIHVLTVTACINGTIQGACNCHVSRQGRQETHDVVWR